MEGVAVKAGVVSTDLLRHQPLCTTRQDTCGCSFSDLLPRGPIYKISYDKLRKNKIKCDLGFPKYELMQNLRSP